MVCFMRKDFWKHPLMQFAPFFAFFLWFSLLTLFGAIHGVLRFFSFLMAVGVYGWGYYFFRSRFFFEFQHGRLTVRQRVVEELSVLNRVLTMMNEERSLQDILRCIVDEAFHLIPTAQSSSFVIYNPTKGLYEFVEVKSQSAEYFTDLFLTPEDVEKKFAGRTRPFVDNKVDKSDQKYSEETRQRFEHYGFPKAIMYIPIRIEGQLKGYITLDNWHDKNAFSAWELHQIEQIQPQLTLAYIRAQRNAELADYKAKLEHLLRSGQELAIIDEPDVLIKQVLYLIKNTLHYTDVCILLVEDDRLVYRGGYRFGEEESFPRSCSFPLHAGICGWVVTHQEPVIVNDVEKDPRYQEVFSGNCAELAVPIKVGNEVLGVINLESTVMNIFTKEDQDLMMGIASQLGVALSNLRHQRELKTALVQIIEALARSIETKDNVTGDHCERMEEFALQVGQAMQLSPDRLENLRQAAILHDIGKIGVPGSILDKPGKLTDEEFAIMKNHPTYGADILREVDFLKDVATVVEQHHERMDGRGYPKGLKGEEICLEARIISIVDAYDAMTSDRPYRSALFKEAALEELSRHAGTQFDPMIVELFTRLLAEEQSM